MPTLWLAEQLKVKLNTPDKWSTHIYVKQTPIMTEPIVMDERYAAIHSTAVVYEQRFEQASCIVLV